MEKAHGWTYVRSKNNGKNRDKATGTNTNNGLPTPQLTNIRTPSSDGNTVDTPEEEDFDMQTGYDGSAMYDNQNHLNFPEYPTSSDMDMFTSNQLQLDYSPISEMNHSGSSTHSPYTANTLAGQDHFQDNFQNFSNNGGDFNLFENDDLYSANVQLPTPSHPIFQRSVGGFETSGVPFGADPVPHFSPVGHGNTMLYTPTSLLEDEGFEDVLPSNCHVGTADFQLFPSSTGGTVASSAPSALFGEIPSTANINYPGVSAQELLDFYAASTAAATAGHHSGGMDWASDDQFTHYERQ
jgi:hypothetical protein